ncbi:MAG: hypothetical protein MUQ10_20225 [Anaerolineae bacterium]|nr:hypothetical protein [Anaerolineae bacterium]
MTSSRSSRRSGRGKLALRAPRKATLIIATAVYLTGLFGALGFFTMSDRVVITALAIAGGLLLFGVLLPGF